MKKLHEDTYADLKVKADEIARDRIADDISDRASEQPGGWRRERAAAEAFEDLYPNAYEEALQELVDEELETAE